MSTSPSSDTQGGSTNNSNATRNLSSLFDQLALDEQREAAARARQEAEARAKKEEEDRQAMRRIEQAMKEAQDRQNYNPRKRGKPGLSSNLGQPKFW